MRALRAAACALSLLSVLAPVSPVRGQDRAAARETYVSELGLRGNAGDIRLYLVDELRAMGHENPEGLAEFFSFIMVLHGLDLDKLLRLQAGGIDIVHSMTSNARPFIEQGLYSDPAVVADVVEFGDAGEAGDGYASTITVRVIERLKGMATPDTIHLRQRRPFSEEAGPHDLVPEEGGRYLLLLSRPMYEYSVWRRSAEGPAVPQPGHYAIYRFYRADDDRVIMGDGSSYDAKSVYQELRWLQELIEEL